MKCIALIPAYRPSAFLPELLEQLKSLGFEIVVVDDGSGAKYEHIFFESSRYAEVLYHTQNAGKGAALKTGFAFIASNYPKDSVIVTIDADGQHKPKDALKICDLSKSNIGALVLGSRKLNKDVPLRSKFGNTVTRFVYRLSTGLNVYDTQTGLRAFSAEWIPEMLKIPGDRYEYEMNVLLQFARNRVPIIEHEIDTVYLDDNSSSHFDAVKDSFRIYKEILKFSASSFIGFLVDYAAYSLLLFAGMSLTASNIIARIISAGTNFALNRKFVFCSNHSFSKSFARYAMLAVCILAGNTFVLNFLSGNLGIHQMLAKIITEIFFFVISWLIQKTVVFRKRGADR